MARKPVQPRIMPPIDMLRDTAIEGFAAKAIADGALVAGMFYITANGEVRALVYPDTPAIGDMLLGEACIARGLTS
jgi:hypothetical protein